MLDSIKDYDVSIPCLTRNKVAWRMKFEKDDKTIIYSGNRDRKFENGVRFVINENILTYIKAFQTINERIYCI